MNKLNDKILITGSEGTIGRIAKALLADQGHEYVTELDRDNPENPVDLLHDNLTPYFLGIHTVIHLAANPNPLISKEEAERNTEMTRRVIKTCDSSDTIERIIYASSINVYPYHSLDKISEKTSLEANTYLDANNKPLDYYGKSKIESEKLLEEFSTRNEISLVNLRFGWVTKNNLHPPYQDQEASPRDIEIALEHGDLELIISKAVNLKGIHAYVCVSKKGGFVDDSIRFPIEKFE